MLIVRCCYRFRDLLRLFCAVPRIELCSGIGVCLRATTVASGLLFRFHSYTIKRRFFGGSVLMRNAVRLISAPLLLVVVTAVAFIVANPAGFEQAIRGFISDSELRNSVFLAMCYNRKAPKGCFSINQHGYQNL